MSSRVDVMALRIFVAIADLGSIGAAADHVGMAQPNASRVLGRWEKEHRVRLLERSTHGTRLSAEGQMLLPRARAAVLALDNVAAELDDISGSGRQLLGIGASQTIAEYLMPRWLAAYRSVKPEVRFDVRIANSSELFDTVLAGSMRLAFVEYRQIPEGLEHRHVGSDRFVLVVSADHPWARRETLVTQQELASTPLVVREPGSGTRHELELLLAGWQVEGEWIEASSNAAVKVHTLSGVAPTFISEQAVRSELEAGMLVSVPLRLGLRPRAFHAVWRRGLKLRSAEIDFINTAARSSRGSGS
ncbi:LysR family transcriptional regulator [Glutamicibacter sp. PS]|uniref:LysR family transcriptional regulator n=1 Tax=Glutamicibacter sp. PS TaxID=3075634 RepID=UPI00284AA178|nr:LysR family transcriptional regulator [Glutamicibacter sp. PS]MDR4533955.1 LysR family transcriptional regulator [Glutamicibacter sp. PS]